jgi:hypothetical protein
MNFNARVAILVFTSLGCAARSEAGGKAGTITYRTWFPEALRSEV